ncbi:hypothetical protein JTE90_000567 [Oedothorax gibbosus]|uniref:Uncharacterized protein n=1 Tax=Oedothorax gibbosus TaxID=931172 RepID=A0AAV6VU62_9ARAC|nr:hypothetical protein JTE90_000567 [Oedothorax gibbosus]
MRSRWKYLIVGFANYYKSMNSSTLPLLFAILCVAALVVQDANCDNALAREKRGIIESTTHYVSKDVSDLVSAIGTFSRNTFWYAVSWLPYLGDWYPGGQTTPTTPAPGTATPGSTDPTTTEKNCCAPITDA